MSENFAIKDFSKSIALRRYWVFMALVKLKLDHRKTVFSVLWEPITVFFVATVLSLVWSQILDIDDGLDYFFYILIGFWLWSLLFAKLVNRGVSSLSNRANELALSAKPISALPLEDVTYSFFNFFLALPFVMIAAIWHYGTSIELVGTFFIGLILVWITGLSLCLTLGVLGFFIRDVLPFISAIMRLGFLTTPIIWKPQRLGELEHLIWYNPFYSYLDICRSSLMGKAPALKSIYVASALSVMLAFVAFIVLSLFGEKIRREVFTD